MIAHRIWEHRRSGAACRDGFRIYLLTLHCFGDFAYLKFWSKISMTTCLTTSGRFLKKLNKNRGIAQLVARDIWEHRCGGAACREGFWIYVFTLHCFGVFGWRKYWSKISMTTCLTTLGKFLKKLNKNRGVAELVPHFIWEHRCGGVVC